MAFLPFSSIAQSNDWTVFKEDQGIKFYYKYADCDFNDMPDAQWVLIKVENTTDRLLLIEWTLHSYFNGVCKLCNNDPNGEARRELKLEPHSSKEGECISSCSKALRIFSKFISFKTDDLLTKFEIDGVILTDIEQ